MTFSFIFYSPSDNIWNILLFRSFCFRYMTFVCQDLFSFVPLLYYVKEKSWYLLKFEQSFDNIFFSCLMKWNKICLMRKNVSRRLYQFAINNYLESECPYIIFGNSMVFIYIWKIKHLFHLTYMWVVQSVLSLVYIKYLHSYSWCGKSKLYVLDVFILDFRTVILILTYFWRDRWRFRDLF